LAAVSVLFVMLAFSPPRFAQGVGGGPEKPAPGSEQAAAYFDQGAALFNAAKYAEAMEFYKKAAKLYAQAGKQNELGASLFNIAAADRNLKNFERSTSEFKKAIPILARAVLLSTQADALIIISHNYSDLSNNAEASRYAEMAAPVYNQAGRQDDEAQAYLAAARGYFRLRKLEPAAALYDKALGIFLTLKDRSNQAVALANLGLINARLEKASTATDYLNMAVAVLDGIDDPELTAHISLILGNAYMQNGDNAEALASYERALTKSRQLDNRSMEAEALCGIGESQSELGDYDAAVKAHTEALNIANELKDEMKQAIQLGDLGLVYMDMGKYDLAFEYDNRSLELTRKLKDRWGEATLLNNMGVAYLRLGSLDKAADYIVRSTQINRQLKDRRSTAQGLTNIGAAYTRLKQFDKAIPYFEESLPVLRELNEFRFIVIANYYYGTLRRERGEIEKAIALHKESIEVARYAHTPKFESRAQIELGLDHLAQNDFLAAAGDFQDALIIAREVKSGEEESAALDGLMQANDRLGQKGLAIFYGKQSINLLQAIRGDIRKFDKDIQTNYVKDNEQTYRRLADILVGEGRLPEAQQVLAMLKEEELSGFVRRDAKEIEALSKRSELRVNERAALERYNLISSRVAALGAELATLEEKKRKIPAGQPFADQNRLDELTAQVKDANTAFRLFLEKGLASELGIEKKREIEADRALQGKLAQWGKGTVAISTIVGDDRYRVILTTPNVQVDGKTEIKSGDLNRKIFEFRAALLNRSLDPRPLGKELYDILVKPIEADLAAAGAMTIIWSLDGTLRYIPVAALWDGDHYLVEKYQNVIVTSTTRQSLLAPVDNDWRILGGGVTKASEVTDPATQKKLSFEELKGVSSELASIIGDRSASGTSLIDNSFSENAIKQQLSGAEDGKRKFNVVHFATHFRLGSDTADSFLLLGDNKALTLEEISDSPDIDLTDVELVTLSACNTGYGGVETKKTLTENNGKEVDSLAQFIELRGAKAVMASLWAVVDESTALMMTEFYRLRRTNPTWSKAEALRQAQLELLNGEIKAAPSAKGKRSDAIALDDSAPNTPHFKPDPTRPFAHPNYWASFVLIGNWR